MLKKISPMPESEFHKYHGLGNDYLVIDPALAPFRVTPETVQAICSRTHGVGSDGILFGPLGGEGGLDLRIFNPDGSEAEKSGNGLRIFAWYLYERGLVGREEFRIVVKGGSATAAVEDSERRVIRIDMGVPDFDARAQGLRTGDSEIVGREMNFQRHFLNVTCVSMGNPHCVVLSNRASSEDARRLGPLLEADSLFPNRTNVQFLEILSRSEIRIEIWERGAGYTLASGSSSCAAAAAARRLGLVGDDITVHMPGGTLDVKFRNERALLTGPVEPVFEGCFSEPLRTRLGLGPRAGTDAAGNIDNKADDGQSSAGGEPPC